MTITTFTLVIACQLVLLVSSLKSEPAIVRSKLSSMRGYVVLDHKKASEDISRKANVLDIKNFACFHKDIPMNKRAKWFIENILDAYPKISQVNITPLTKDMASIDPRCRLRSSALQYLDADAVFTDIVNSPLLNSPIVLLYGDKQFIKTRPDNLLAKCPQSAVYGAPHAPSSMDSLGIITFGPVQLNACLKKYSTIPGMPYRFLRADLWDAVFHPRGSSLPRAINNVELIGVLGFEGTWQEFAQFLPPSLSKLSVRFTASRLSSYRRMQDLMILLLLHHEFPEMEIIVNGKEFPKAYSKFLKHLENGIPSAPPIELMYQLDDINPSLEEGTEPVQLKNDETVVTDEGTHIMERDVVPHIEHQGGIRTLPFHMLLASAPPISQMVETPTVDTSDVPGTVDYARARARLDSDKTSVESIDSSEGTTSHSEKDNSSVDSVLSSRSSGESLEMSSNVPKDIISESSEFDSLQGIDFPSVPSTRAFPSVPKAGTFKDSQHSSRKGTTSHSEKDNSSVDSVLSSRSSGESLEMSSNVPKDIISESSEFDSLQGIDFPSVPSTRAFPSVPKAGTFKDSQHSSRKGALLV